MSAQHINQYAHTTHEHHDYDAAQSYEREQGSCDWRMLPVALVVWGVNLIVYQLWNAWQEAPSGDGYEPHMATSGISLGDSRTMMLLIVALASLLLGIAVGIALRCRRKRQVAGILTVCCIAAMISAAATIADTTIQWHDAAMALARDGPQYVSAIVHVTSPTVSASKRDADCQVDGVIRTIFDGTVERSANGAVRVFLQSPHCTTSIATGSYQVSGELATAEYGSKPLWLIADDRGALREVAPPRITAHAVAMMQQAMFAVCADLSDQARILVPGLTVGVLGQDIVLQGTAAASSEPSTIMDSLDINATYAEQLEDSFRRSGIMHLMAVSGGHFMILAGFIRRMCARMLTHRWITALAMIAGNCALAAIVFPSDSVLRALSMGCLSAICLGLGRRSQTVSGLCWTVIVMLILTPSMARSYGFALSCAAVLGIALIASPVQHMIAILLPDTVAEATAMTIAAQVFTLPIQVLMEPELPILSIPANVLVAPFVGFATIAGLMALAVSWLSPDIGYALAWIAGCGTRVMERCAIWLGGKQYATVPWAGDLPGVLLILLVEGVIAAGVMLCVRALARRSTPDADSPSPGARKFPFRPRERFALWLSDTKRMLEEASE
ncbi:competence protein [Bifidobacterium goeldii]|uniref:Competence protein n=1 Tax=Bifidobacterium goeldii TaxID=2306975 RepID=A0A430FK53_9BIFI|nr:ComEC/Rec2 family competence protein [Bifidobacterium goeldii]RSX53269.1 competence protein [Bifidobacterium goeldii]